MACVLPLKSTFTVSLNPPLSPFFVKGGLLSSSLLEREDRRDSFVFNRYSDNKTIYPRMSMVLSTKVTSISVSVRNRYPSVPAESAWSYLNPRRTLPAFILISIHQYSHMLHQSLIITHGHNLLNTLILLHVGFQDGIEDFVRRKAVRILLIRLQLG